MRLPPWPVLLPPSCPCFPGRPLCPAAAGLRLLSSPSSLFVLFPRPLRCLCLFWCVVCCPPFLVVWFCLVWPLVVGVGFFSCLVFLVRSSRLDVGLVGCACCQLT